MDVKKSHHKLGERGQSIVEFLLFLPFMLMMYSVSMSLSNAINASINQQKIARAFWHYRNHGNSTIPRPRRDGATEPSAAWQVFGMQIMGWSRELKDGRFPVAPCYKFKLPLGSDGEDECEQTYSSETTQFIRVKTVYGVCGATYIKKDGYNISYPRGASLGEAAGQLEHCTIVK